MNRLIIGAVGALVVLGAIYFYGQRQYQAGINECNRTHNEAALEAFKTESSKLAGLSAGLQEQIDTLAKTRPKIIERYNHVTTEIPLSVDCVLDAERLRNINDAIRASNAAR